MSNRQQTIRVDWDDNENISITYKTRDGGRRIVSELIIENMYGKNYTSTIVTSNAPKILIKL